MKTTVTITWDQPKDKNWLCPENIELALSAYCKNTKFKVVEIAKRMDIAVATTKKEYVSGWPICDVLGCEETVCNQGGHWSNTGYWCVCPEHSQDGRDGKDQPVMKKEALERQIKRSER